MNKIIKNFESNGATVIQLDAETLAYRGPYGVWTLVTVGSIVSSGESIMLNGDYVTVYFEGQASYSFNLS